MTKIILKPGGVLLFQKSTGEILDVSEDALAYLFELIELDSEVTLEDVFLVLRRNPVMNEVFARVAATELLEEALAGAKAPYSSIYDPEKVEYLEIGRNCRFDDKTGEFDPMHVLMLSAVGFVLKESLEKEHFYVAAGERPSWSVGFTSPQDWLAYPLRLEANTEIWESGKTERKCVNFGLPTLGQLIHSILFELSFFGVGPRQEEIADKIQGEHVWHEVDKDEFIQWLGEEDG